jgi:hypothetical protein
VSQRIDDPTVLETPDGWQRISAVCGAGRRSLWMRLHYATDENNIGRVVRIELCGGREGDDDYLVIDESNPQLQRIVDLLCCGRFAVES